MTLQAWALALWIISFGLPVAANEAGEDSIARAVKVFSLSAIISGQREGDSSWLTGLQCQEVGALQLE